MKKLFKVCLNAECLQSTVQEDAGQVNTEFQIVVASNEKEALLKVWAEIISGENFDEFKMESPTSAVLTRTQKRYYVGSDEMREDMILVKLSICEEDEGSPLNQINNVF